jgi:mannose-6-phosphate isomerase-like protein (cupin superfamily)
MIEELDGWSVPVHFDKRGESRDFRSFLVEGLHVVTMEPGAVRGDHVHDRDEILCVAGGSGICEILTGDKLCAPVEKIIVAGDITVYRIKAGVKHVVRNSGNRRFYLISFYEPLSKPPERSKSAV